MAAMQCTVCACQTHNDYYFPIQIRPKLDVQINLTRKMQVVDAIQEIAMMDAAEGGSNQWLCKEYSDIYNEQEALRYVRTCLCSNSR